VKEGTRSHDEVGIYVGESSRTLAERASEHVNGALSLDVENFITKHWALQHNEMKKPPRIRFQPIRTFRDALSRLVSESVWIEKKANMNSKGEWRSNKVSRLKVEKSKKVGKEQVETERKIEEQIQTGLAKIAANTDIRVSKSKKQNPKKTNFETSKLTPVLAEGSKRPREPGEKAVNKKRKLKAREEVSEGSSIENAEVVCRGEEPSIAFPPSSSRGEEPSITSIHDASGSNAVQEEVPSDKESHGDEPSIASTPKCQMNKIQLQKPFPREKDTKRNKAKRDSTRNSTKKKKEIKRLLNQKNTLIG